MKLPVDHKPLPKRALSPESNIDIESNPCICTVIDVRLSISTILASGERKFQLYAGYIHQTRNKRRLDDNGLV